MKKASIWTVIIVALSLLGVTVANSAQTNLFYPFLNTSNYSAPGHLDALGNVLHNADGTSSMLNVSGVAVTVKASAGRIATINVLSASGTPAIYDTAASSTAAASNQVAVIPATVGVYRLNFPMANGITVNPSSSVVSISYQ